MWQILSVVVFIILGIVPARAADAPIPGRKIVIKTEPVSAKRRFVFASGADVGITAAADPTQFGADLMVAGLICVGEDCAITGSSGLVHLPADYWIGLGTPPGSEGFRYKDPSASAGGIRKAVFKPGKIVIKGSGDDWNWVPAGGEDRVALTWEVGADRLCAVFGGAEKGNEPGYLSYRNADAPAVCPALCGNHVAEADETCDGDDSTECSGLCQSDCTCPAPVCGNDVRESGEQCDGFGGFDPYCGGDTFPMGCTPACRCCVPTGSYGCSFFDCCSALYCWPTAGEILGVCTDLPFPY